MIGDEKIFAEEKIQLVRVEFPVLPAVFHRVNHQEQIRREQVALLRRVFLYLRRRTDGDAILDGQRMEMEYPGENRLHLLRRGIFKIHPEEEVRVRQQRGHEEQVNALIVQPALDGKGK